MLASTLAAGYNRHGLALTLPPDSDKIEADTHHLDPENRA